MKTTIKDLDVSGKKVLVRVDYNVPMKDGVITDDTRIKESIPTLMYLLDHGAKLILMSHLGRPEGVDKKYSLAPVAKRLKDLLNVKVVMSKDVVGPDTQAKVQKLDKGILLLENLRFEKGEETNDPKFVNKLAKLGDIYVNDAFGTAHRKHASTYGVAEKLPNAIGFLMEKEVSSINRAFNHAERPFTAILGGAKVSDKLKIIYCLLERVDNIIIGGAMAYTFLKAKGYSVANSKVEDDMVQDAANILAIADDKKVKVYLPCDHIVTTKIDDYSNVEYIKTANIPEGYIGMDIGKKTIKQYSKVIKKSKTILWNGPMGMFEVDKFANGTKQICKAVAKSKGYSIVGGGDSASAVVKFGYKNKISHISTGGGASLKMFEGKELPALQVITDKN